MRYVVLGSRGQLGRDLCPRLTGDVTALTREHIELARPETIRNTLHDLRPDIVINCAAYNLVDRAETEAQAAFAVNAWGLRALAVVCQELDCTLVHFSTDYVFGLEGARETPYAETDAPGPISMYGLSKLTGEYLVRSGCQRHFIIRTCGLYGVWGSGGKGGNFVETMLRLAREGKALRVVSDQICTPSYTTDIATAVAPLIQTSQYGLYHVTNGGQCSWYEFAKTIFEHSGVRASLTPTTSEEYGAPARRPAYSVLAANAYRSLGLPPLRHWTPALSAYLAERELMRK
jgi:dTDP-4-dehydrorhamnose reductase